MSDSEEHETTDHQDSDGYEESEGSESDGISDSYDCLYGNEPEYTAAELSQMNEELSETSLSDSSEDEDLDNSRLINLHWCGCGKCQIMPTLIESKLTNSSHNTLVMLAVV